MSLLSERVVALKRMMKDSPRAKYYGVKYGELTRCGSVPCSACADIVARSPELLGLYEEFFGDPGLEILEDNFDMD